MELMPWRPFRGLTSLRREMDDLWNRFFSAIPLLRRHEGEWAPSADISKNKENFIVQAELPGVEKKEHLGWARPDLIENLLLEFCWEA